jgi:hypothetical protein
MFSLDWWKLALKSEAGSNSLPVLTFMPPNSAFVSLECLALVSGLYYIGMTPPPLSLLSEFQLRYVGFSFAHPWESHFAYVCTFVVCS